MQALLDRSLIHSLEVKLQQASLLHSLVHRLSLSKAAYLEANSPHLLELLAKPHNLLCFLRINKHSQLLCLHKILLSHQELASLETEQVKEYLEEINLLSQKASLASSVQQVLSAKMLQVTSYFLARSLKIRFSAAKDNLLLSFLDKDNHSKQLSSHSQLSKLSLLPCSPANQLKAQVCLIQIQLSNQLFLEVLLKNQHLYLANNLLRVPCSLVLVNQQAKELPSHPYRTTTSKQACSLPHLSLRYYLEQIKIR